MSIYCFVRKDYQHETIVFPNDDLEFAIPPGYATLHIESYKKLVLELRQHRLW